MTSDNPKPDTSKANVAIERAERAIYAELFRELKSVMILGDDRLSAPQVERIAYVCADSALRTLADVPDTQPTVAWEERVRAFTTAYYANEYGTLECPFGHSTCLDDAAIRAGFRAAFPELALKEPTL